MLEKLEYIIALAREKNFARAAESDAGATFMPKRGITGYRG